jgi:diaminohydroxyphosphoribosylaminopyrimidine deaminase/5-amino-6-(5-phosphoribosylamino)uracil reductase
VRDGIVDRVVWYVAPLLVGGAAAPGALEGAGFAPITEALRLDLVSVDRVGEDLRVEADVHRDR